MTILESALSAPADKAAAAARDVKFGRVLMLLVTGVFFVLGWLTARGLRALWFAGVFIAMSVAEGWQQGWKRQPAGS